ncbi:DUF6318 family protein [Arthrobacter sp. FW305-123]|nr:DUF6318 family protein [Arthrobacter sp. FW305-123]
MSRLSFAHFCTVHVRTAAFGLAAVVLLSGCQAASAPGGSPSETSSTTASPTSSASAPEASATPVAPPAVYKPADASGKAQNVPVPVMPELAKENSKAGLEAFIGYWYSTFSFAAETGDMGLWSPITDLSNPVAAAYNAAIERNYSQGKWMVGGQVSTPVIDILWTEGARVQEARVQVIQTETQYFNADGTEGRARTPRTNIAEAVFSKFGEGSWVVIDNGMIVGQK